MWDIVSSLGLSITAINTSGILSDTVLSEHAIINWDKLSESSALVKSGILLGNVELSSINPKKGETSFCDSNTSNNAQQSSVGGVIGIGSRGAKSRPAINPSEDSSNSTKLPFQKHARSTKGAPTAKSRYLLLLLQHETCLSAS
jgi:hypothetical protein